MLTIKPPIRLTAQRFGGMLRPDLAEKIRGNYQLIRPGIRTEELLHVAAAASELYFAEGGGISIQNQIQTENQQEFRLEVINHLVNRILISNTGNFRYQDIVYVSNILRRLGIRQESHFLRLVRQLQEEKQENKKLIELYEDHRKLLSLFIQEETTGQTKETEKDEQEQLPDRPEYFLQEEIYKRLDTRQIYQDIKSFSQGIQNTALRIYQSEFRVAEQSALIQEFRLNELKQQVFHQEQPLYYYHANEYELAGEEEVTVEAARDRLSAALLLNLVDQAYTLRQEHIEQDSHRWYSLAGALFESIENTWQRYSIYHQERRMAGSHIYETQIEINQERRQEQQIIEQIVGKVYESEENWLVQNLLRQEMETRTLLPGQPPSEISLSGGHYHGTPEPLPLSYLPEETEETVEDGEEKTEPWTAERIQEQLAAFNERNLEHLRKITEIRANQPLPGKKTLNREKARKDLLRAMEHPQEVLAEYLASERISRQEEIREQMEDEIYNLFSEETKEIYRRYLEQRNNRQPAMLQKKPELPEGIAKPESAQEEAVRPGDKELIREVEGHIQKELQKLEIQTERTKEQERIQNELRQTLVKIQELSAADTIRSEIAETPEGGHSPFVHREQEGEAWQVRTEEAQENVEAEKASGQREQAQEIRERIREESSRQTERVLLPVMTQIVGKELLREFTALREQTPLRFYRNYLVEQEENVKVADRPIEQTAKQQQKAEAEKLILTERLWEQAIEHRISAETAGEGNALRSVSLVHKEEEQQLNEELLETIRQRTQSVRREESHEERTIQKSSVTETKLQETMNQIRVEQTENIEELIRQKLQQNLGRISDQVYGRIEKKLQTERKRRGF